MTRAVPLLGFVLAAACSTDAPVPPAAIEPGVRLTAGGVEVQLGEPGDALEEQVGRPASTRQLGRAGVRLLYTDLHVSVILRPEGVQMVCAEPGYAGRTSGGLGLGSGREQVRAALGESEVDPFLGAWLYGARGIVFEWSDDRVVRLCVLPAAG